MALREARGFFLSCIACATIPTCCLWTAADALSKDSVGPLFWVVGGLVEIAIGVVAAALGCVLAWFKGTREAVDGMLDPIGAKIVDERRATNGLRYLIGMTLALLGVAFGFFRLLDVVHKAME
jgi:hypothetical protein